MERRIENALKMEQDRARFYEVKKEKIMSEEEIELYLEEAEATLIDSTQTLVYVKRNENGDVIDMTWDHTINEYAEEHGYRIEYRFLA